MNALSREPYTVTYMSLVCHFGKMNRTEVNRPLTHTKNGIKTNTNKAGMGSAIQYA